MSSSSFFFEMLAFIYFGHFQKSRKTTIHFEVRRHEHTKSKDQIYLLICLNFNVQLIKNAFSCNVRDIL